MVNKGAVTGAARWTAIASIAVAAIAAAILLWMGRPPICACGTIELWHGAVDAGNSQHLLDWYSLSHVIHGLLFYAAGQLALRQMPLHVRFLLAVGIEAAWELIENSPAVIDRYRTATIALGYTGDSVINSLADIACMMIGFAIARLLPVVASLGLGLALELIALAAIRDNLTLNILMLVDPIEAVRRWQAGP